MADGSVDRCVQKLIAAFTTYDHAVNVVSAFEMLYTESDTTLPATVQHFERFPKVKGADGNNATPDFSVVFHDGTGLAGEVARIASQDQSAARLCKQLLRYDALPALPVQGGTQDVAHCDVVLLVPFAHGTAAVSKVLNERMANEAHSYRPSVAPCIIQFTIDGGRWVFQRIEHPLNGELREEGRDTGISEWLAIDTIKVKPERFADIKAKKAFINDNVDSLYLATHLWQKTFANIAGAREDTLPVLLQVTVEQIAADIQAKHGHVRHSDIKRALELLRTAKLAESSPDGSSWQVAWEKLHSTGDKELERILARRACSPPATSRPAAVRRQLRGREPDPGQLELFGKRLIARPPRIAGQQETEGPGELPPARQP